MALAVMFATPASASKGNLATACQAAPALCQTQRGPAADISRPGIQLACNSRCLASCQAQSRSCAGPRRTCAEALSRCVRSCGC